MSVAPAPVVATLGIVLSFLDTLNYLSSTFMKTTNCDTVLADACNLCSKSAGTP